MFNQEYLTAESKIRAKRKGTAVPPFDSLASAYDAWFDRQGKLIFSIEVRAFQEVLPSLPKPWVEIGVGSGRFAQALGIETGVDPSIKLLKMARKRGIITFLGRGEQELFDERSFGTVFLIVTLCFVDSPLDVLKQASHILVPGGRIVLGLVLKESPWGKFYQQKKKHGHCFYRYATFYNCDQVTRLLDQAGFLTEKIVSTLFQEPDKVNHMEKPREGYSPGAGFTVIVAGKQAVTNETMATSAPGIFAAGDIRRNSPRQIAAAVGDGVTAAMSAFKYVHEQGNGTRLTSP